MLMKVPPTKYIGQDRPDQAGSGSDRAGSGSDRAGSGSDWAGSGSDRARSGSDRARAVRIGQPIFLDLDRYQSISANIFNGGIST